MNEGETGPLRVESLGISGPMYRYADLRPPFLVDGEGPTPLRHDLLQPPLGCFGRGVEAQGGIRQAVSLHLTACQALNSGRPLPEWATDPRFQVLSGRFR